MMSEAAPAHRSENDVDALSRWLRRALDADALRILRMDKMSGGAIQENWTLDVEVEGGPYAGSQQWVLRTDAPSAVATSLGRMQEYAVLRTAHAAGVKVPSPIVADGAAEAMGRPFFIMQRVPGIAVGHRLTREAGLVPDPAALVDELARNLARLHSVAPPQPELAFLAMPAGSPALVSIAEYRAYLDQLDEPQPVLEWGLRWCERHAPDDYDVRLLHRDYRTGNYLVEGGRLSGVLDWEFAAFGDPREDLGWFTARCWRFAAPEREAGGIGAVEDFLAAYREESGREIGREALTYWQVMAHLRWSIIALQQAQRHLSGQERSLELALTGRLLPELEIEILDLIEGDRR